MNNVSFNKNNTKKELLDIISKLKKSEIVSMLNTHNNNVSMNNVSMNNVSNNENNNNNENTKVNASKNKIKLPKNLSGLKYNNKRGTDNEIYKNV